MKGEKADYTINLKKAFLFPPLIRVRKALTQIRKFVWKHARTKKYAVSNEVNEFIHANSKNIPKRIKATFLREGDTVRIFLQGGKGMAAYLKKKESEKKKKEDKKEAKEKGKEAQAESEEEKKRKLGEKKEKEEAAKAANIKRKTSGGS